MASYNVNITPVGSDGGGCIGPLVVLFICIVVGGVLVDSCQSPLRSGGERSGATSRTDGRVGSETQLNAYREETNETKQPVWKLFVNSWMLERLLEEGHPVTLVAIPQAPLLEEGIVGALNRKGGNAYGGVLTPEAYQSDELFQRLQDGDDLALQDLLLDRLSGYLVLGRIFFSETRALREGYRTRAYFRVTLVPLSGGRPAEHTFEARGSGFEAAEAREQATQRVQDDFSQSALVDRLTLR